jgi:DNA mismatch repair protein MutL
VHDFVRDSLRMALIKARPAAGFLAALDSAALASPSLVPPATSRLPGSPESPPIPEPESEPISAQTSASDAEPFRLTSVTQVPISEKLLFDGNTFNVPAISAAALVPTVASLLDSSALSASGECSSNHRSAVDPLANGVLATAQVEAEQAAANLNHLGALRPFGQLRESFILASGEDGLWIIDQHVAHERVLFEKILRERNVERVQRQRLLMPLLVELRPWQMLVFAQIADELDRNGFEAEPFGPQTLTVKSAPVGLEGAELERTLAEIVEQASPDSAGHPQNQGLANLRTRIAASIACHSAIKVNTPLDPVRMEWLLSELAKTEHPTSCPHGRPIALLYSWKDIQRAFHRI